MDLTGFKKIVPVRGAFCRENAGYLSVKKKSCWISVGSDLTKQIDLPKDYDMVEMFVKDIKNKPYEITLHFTKKGIYKLFRGRFNMGFRSTVLFKLYKDIEGIYELKEISKEVDGVYVLFKYFGGIKK